MIDKEYKMPNNATFLKSSFNLNGTFVQEGELKITESNSKKQIITFECKLDETYFCKVTGFFTESKNAMQTIRLFYKVENDTDDIIVKSEGQKFGFRKVNDDESELPEEEEPEDEDDDVEDDEDEEDDEGMTLEMRVEQLKKLEFSNYFSDEE